MPTTAQLLRQHLAPSGYASHADECPLFLRKRTMRGVKRKEAIRLDGGMPARSHAVSLSLATSVPRAVPIARLRGLRKWPQLGSLFILLMLLFGPQARPGSTGR